MQILPFMNLARMGPSDRYAARTVAILCFSKVPEVVAIIALVHEVERGAEHDASEVFEGQLAAALWHAFLREDFIPELKQLVVVEDDGLNCGLADWLWSCVCC